MSRAGCTDGCENSGTSHTKDKQNVGSQERSGSGPGLKSTTKTRLKLKVKTFVAAVLVFSTRRAAGAGDGGGGRDENLSKLLSAAENGRRDARTKSAPFFVFRRDVSPNPPKCASARGSSSAVSWVEILGLKKRLFGESWRRRRRRLVSADNMNLESWLPLFIILKFRCSDQVQHSNFPELKARPEN